MNTPERDRYRASRMGGLAIADQCLFSGTNFVTAVIVGRVAGPRELGIYSLVFSVVMITLALQRALLIAPFVVLRDQATPARAGSMKATMLGVTIAAGVMAGLIAGLVFAWSGYPAALLLAFAVPAGFLRDFARQIALTEFRFVTALGVDACVAVSQLGGLILIARSFSTAPGTGLTASMALSLSSTCWVAVGVPAIAWVLRRELRWPAQWWADFQALFVIGRWVSLSQVLSTVQSFLMPWILAAFHSLELAGVYAACWALVQVVSPAIEGLGNLLGPALARSAARGDWDELTRRLRLATWVFTVVMASMLLGVLLFGRLALATLYGASFADASSVLLILSIAAAVGNLGIPTGKLLTQIGHARFNVAAMVLSIVTVCLTSIVCLSWLGPGGAAWGLVAGCSLSTTARWWWLYRIDEEVAVEVRAASTNAATTHAPRCTPVGPTEVAS